LIFSFLHLYLESYTNFKNSIFRNLILHPYLHVVPFPLHVFMLLCCMMIHFFNRHQMPIHKPGKPLKWVCVFSLVPSWNMLTQFMWLMLTNHKNFRVPHASWYQEGLGIVGSQGWYWLQNMLVRIKFHTLVFAWACRFWWSRCPEMCVLFLLRCNLSL
jgi:hypothetical protein